MFLGAICHHRGHGILTYRPMYAPVRATSPSVPLCRNISYLTRTVRQPFGGSQSPDDARIAAIARAKREALEMAGTYVQALTAVKNSRVEKDVVLALTTGVVRAEIVSQKNYATADAFGIQVTVKARGGYGRSGRAREKVARGQDPPGSAH